MDGSTLDKLHRDAALAWPTVEVDRDTFAATLATALETGVAVDELHTRDLYLVAACLEGNDEAIAIFSRDIMGAVTPAIRRIAREDPSNVDDIVQTVLAKLLVGNPKPLLATYIGKGPLVGWVRVVATRDALQAARKNKREHATDDDLLAGAARSTGQSIELRLLKEKHRETFGDAVIEATKRLTSEQRTILRFHARDHLSIDAIAPMLGIHRATAARRIDKAREDVLAFTKAILRERHGLSESEVASLCTALGGTLDLSMGRALETKVG